MRSFNVHVQLQNSRDQITQLPKELCKQRKCGYMYLLIYKFFNTFVNYFRNLYLNHYFAA